MLAAGLCDSAGATARPRPGARGWRLQNITEAARGLGHASVGAVGRRLPGHRLAYRK